MGGGGFGHVVTYDVTYPKNTLNQTPNLSALYLVQLVLFGSMYKTVLKYLLKCREHLKWWICFCKSKNWLNLKLQAGAQTRN